MLQQGDPAGAARLPDRGHRASSAPLRNVFFSGGERPADAGPDPATGSATSPSSSAGRSACSSSSRSCSAGGRYPLLWWVPVFLFAFLGDNLRTFVEHSHVESDAERRRAPPRHHRRRTGSSASSLGADEHALARRPPPVAVDPVLQPARRRRRDARRRRAGARSPAVAPTWATCGRYARALPIEGCEPAATVGLDAPGPALRAELDALRRAARRRAPSSPRCDVCGGTDAAPLAAGLRLRAPHLPQPLALRSAARRAAHVWLDPRPDVDALDVIYPPTYYAYNYERDLAGRPQGQGAARRPQDPQDPRAAAGGPRRRYLDVGCGDGRYLEALAGRGIPAVGLLRPRARRADRRGAAPSAGFRSICERVETCERFAPGTLRPHHDVPRHRARRLAGDRARAARRGGSRRAVCSPSRRRTSTASTPASSPTARGAGYHIPRHWHLFRPTTLTRLLESVGLEVDGGALPARPRVLDVLVPPPRSGTDAAAAPRSRGSSIRSRRWRRSPRSPRFDAASAAARGQDVGDAARRREAAVNEPDRRLQARLDELLWYHSIDVAPGVSTKGGSTCATPSSSSRSPTCAASVASTSARGTGSTPSSSSDGGRRSVVAIDLPDLSGIDYPPDVRADPAFDPSQTVHAATQRRLPAAARGPRLVGAVGAAQRLRPRPGPARRSSTSWCAGACWSTSAIPCGPSMPSAASPPGTS